MFEACVKLQKESRKHVHILIDEIDSVLNKDKEYGATNLTLEIQILMDGVVHYPQLSVLGATNSPDRIPMPMIRRFSKALIVGELTQSHRIQLLKQFVSYMPEADWTDQHWNDIASKLDGATGDVIRKVVDNVWRTKMRQFTRENEDVASNLVESLNTNGQKFQVAHFDDKKRRVFKEELGKYVQIRPSDVMYSVDVHLTNIAIHHEIETAKETYSKAKQFIDQLKHDKIA